jgi:hypothetical protein
MPDPLNETVLNQLAAIAQGDQSGESSRSLGRFVAQVWFGAVEEGADEETAFGLVRAVIEAIRGTG